MTGPTTEDVNGPARTRTWEVPAEPGPEVTKVRNKVGELWVRRPDGMWAWDWEAGGISTHPKTWRSLLVGYGPLADATREPTDGAA